MDAKPDGPAGPCPLCRPPDPARVLWAGVHYRLLAHARPRCLGHVLLASRQHLPSHMHAPAHHLAELEAAQERARRFLCDTFGRACFVENGGLQPETAHAHLNGLPLDPRVPHAWIRGRVLRRVAGWPAVRAECERRGCYVYLDTSAGRYVLENARDDYALFQAELSQQLLAQANAAPEPAAGAAQRGGEDVAARTAHLWRRWAQGARA